MRSKHESIEVSSLMEYPNTKTYPFINEMSPQAKLAVVEADGYAGAHHHTNGASSFLSISVTVAYGKAFYEVTENLFWELSRFG
jgi:hypothetical protein